MYNGLKIISVICTFLAVILEGIFVFYGMRSGFTRQLFQYSVGGMLLIIVFACGFIWSAQTVRKIKQKNKNVYFHSDFVQGLGHIKINPAKCRLDALTVSSHKVYGPTGVGVLYGKEEWLDKLPPYQGGGEMIQSVSFEKITFNELPFKFEAGTPDYIGTTGLAKALDYVSAIGLEQIAAHEHELTTYAMQRLGEIEGMRFLGEAAHKSSVVSFLVGNIHPFDMGTLLDRLGIAVRTGHHCAEPLMRRLGIEGTVRASFAMYNTKEEIDALVAGVDRVRKMF